MYNIYRVCLWSETLISWLSCCQEDYMTIIIIEISRVHEVILAKRVQVG